jgi:hypothetical protein
MLGKNYTSCGHSVCRTGLISVALLLSACGTTAIHSASRTTTSSTNVESRQSEFARLPKTYSAACTDEGSVCSRNTPGVLLGKLKRPLHLPKVGPGQSCPVSKGSMLVTPNFGGVALGDGPVRVIVAMNSGNVSNGVVNLSASDTPGWFAFKTLWISVPAYLGPFVVRGERLDGSGLASELDYAAAGALVVPPGRTLNEYSGFRTAPTGTYVTQPGCYGFQIDGSSFSYPIVLEAVVP